MKQIQIQGCRMELNYLSNEREHVHQNVELIYIVENSVRVGGRRKLPACTESICRDQSESETFFFGNKRCDRISDDGSVSDDQQSGKGTGPPFSMQFRTLCIAER